MVTLVEHANVAMFDPCGLPRRARPGRGLAITTLGRPAEPDDIGRVIAALLADDMGWINGERIEASGGMKL